MRLKPPSALALCLAVLVAGCGSSVPDEPDPIPATPSMLEGKGFEEVSESGLDLPGKHSTRISFSRDSLDFDAGCNHQFGPYELRNGVLTTPGFGSTEVGCAKSLLRRDDMVSAFLRSSPTLALTGGTLVMSGQDGVMELRDAQVKRPGEKWLHGWRPRSTGG